MNVIVTPIGIFWQKIGKALDYRGELLYNVCAYGHF